MENETEPHILQLVVSDNLYKQIEMNYKQVKLNEQQQARAWRMSREIND